jgi:hypothetical protein
VCLVARADLSFVLRSQSAFRQQQAPQAAQIIQDTPAARDMKIELGEVIRNQEQRFLTSVRTILLCGGDFCFDVAPGFIHGFGEHSNILVRPLNTVKRRFGFLAHNPPSRPPALAGGPSKYYVLLIVAQMKPGGNR